MRTESESFRERLKEIAREIKKRNGKSVGVQLPDGLKRLSPEISEILSMEGFEIYISGEHSFGACDIDYNLLEIAGYLIHIGHTPIIRDDRIFYIPYHVDYDIQGVENAIRFIRGDKIILTSTAQYAWKLPEAKKFLEGRGFRVELKKGGRGIYPGQILGCSFKPAEGEGEILFIGDGMFHPLGVALKFRKRVTAWNPLTSHAYEVDPGKFLKRRYGILARCYDMESCGIILSTKPGQKRLQLARKAKKIASKKYTSDIIVVNEINPEKLENLPYEFYVNTACPRITYDDVEKFSKPVITFQELEMLTGLREWSSYIIDEMED